ncbi:Resistance to glucose repression protein 1, partial [Fusarium oxysporum f. sp. albedinis]
VLAGVLWTRLMGLHGLGATLNHCHYRQFQPMVNVESI